MNYRNVNTDEEGVLFGKWKIMNGVWAITNRWKNFMYLLIGEQKALLIDSGYGEGNLRKIIEGITDKPVMVINTHGHFDHTGGNAWWEEAWMTKEAVPQARIPFSKREEEFFSNKPYKQYKTNIVVDGDIIDLGEGRQIEVITIPSHNESSIALLDRQKRLLFTGDEIEGGQVLLFVRHHNLIKQEVAAVHKANMEKIKARRKEFDFLCPAHNGCMLEPDQYLNDFIALSEALIKGTAKAMPDTAGFGFPPHPENGDTFFSKFGELERVQSGEASFIYIK